MYAPELLEHFQNPRNAGELLPPAIVVEVTNPACGDILRLSARIEEGKIAESRFKTRGCTASIAASSALTELMLGRSLAELKTLRQEDIEQAIGGLPPESKHAASLCIDGIRAFLIRAV